MPYLWVFVLIVLCFAFPSVSMDLKNPVKKPIIQGNKSVYTSFFAKIPDYRGKGSKIVSMTSRGNSLYVCTSTSGGLIYKVSGSKRVQLWFDVAGAMQGATGRRMSVKNEMHGGLRSMAFHPDFNQNGLFYTAVMEEKPGQSSGIKYFSRTSKTIAADSVVIEWRFSLKEKRIERDSYRQVIRIGMPVFDHPVRGLLFVGKNLLIAHGDGSKKSATTGGGQKNDGLGKILRINPLQQGGNPYTIPTNNPFLSNPKWANELYAVGFRNPIHMCMSKKQRVGLVVVDVGRDNVDEINFVRAGGNYGWSKREGTFVHKEKGGLINGVGPLPGDDAKNGFIYPVAQVGHFANETGKEFFGQALTGSCPIENGSPLNDVMLYVNFPKTGDLYYSTLNDMASARTTGSPSGLTQATTFRPKIYFDHDNNKGTPAKKVENLRAIVRMDPGRGRVGRADVRFGQGSKGEIYWSSKINGKIYIITSTLPGENQ